MAEEKFILHLNSDQMEKSTDSLINYPCRVGHEKLSDWTSNSFPCHWHPDIEITLVLEGAMLYQANDTEYKIESGNGIFVNANTLHTARTLNCDDCRYDVFVIGTSAIYGTKESLIYKKYFEPIDSSSGIFAKKLLSSDSLGSKVISDLNELSELYDTDSCVKELMTASILNRLWANLFAYINPDEINKNASSVRDFERLKQALEFIDNFYGEPITLEDIANAAHISRSECCHLFKRMLFRTAFSYLTEVRIEKSLPLLIEDRLKVSDIAVKCGFGGNSYFSKTFKASLGVTPNEFKKNHQKL